MNTGITYCCHWHLRRVTFHVCFVIVAGANWTGHSFMLAQKDCGSAGGYPVAAARSMPNGIKDFNQPVSDMLEKNAHLCRVLNAPLPNSAIRVPTNRVPVPFMPNTAERRIAGGNHLPQTAQHQCQSFSNGANNYCGVYSRLPVMFPGNRPVVRGYCDSNMSLHGCRSPVNGVLLSYAETRNGHCATAAAPGVMVGHNGQPVSCRSYGPAMRWYVPTPVSCVNTEFACKVNGVADSVVPSTASSASSLQFSSVLVSAVDSFIVHCS